MKTQTKIMIQDTISGNGQRWVGEEAEYDSDAMDKTMKNIVK